MIEFTVYGQPQSAGSKRAFPFRRKNGQLGVAVSDDNPKSKDWKQLVAMTAQQHRPQSPLEGPISLGLVFVRTRPGGHFNTRGELNKKGRECPSPIAKPDVLKLARAVEDSLTGIIWRDDSQIVDEHIVKQWGDAACVMLRIVPLDQQAAAIAAS